MAKILWGVSALSHDASLCVIRQEPGFQDELVYASHAERYSRIKNDSQLQPEQLKEAYMLAGPPDHVYWFENPLLKRMRFLTSGDWREAISLCNSPTMHMRSLGLRCPITYGSHHMSHAAGTYFTRPAHWGADQVDVLVADAIGEFDTMTAWIGAGSSLIPLLDMYPTADLNDSYPKSLGLLYTAATQEAGLKPNEEEFIFMGMAAFGKVQPNLLDDLYADLLEGKNLHRGLIVPYLDTVSSEDLAATVQHVCELYLKRKLMEMRSYTKSKYLCLSGGVALNCVANTTLAQELGYEDIWIMPNPGDAGSSLGAILQHTRKRVHFENAFLGTNIPYKESNTAIVDHLLRYGIAGVARGCAEWGPRALGNRSLLADPRKASNKNLVNTVKNRQKFRPFAPVVLSEYADQYFSIPSVSDLQYMQYAVRCKKPDAIPAVVHEDGTSRVQVVGTGHPLRDLLDQWFRRTGCPVLLNTSLNVKGEPLVNSRDDADRFQRKHKIKVFS